MEPTTPPHEKPKFKHLRVINIEDDYNKLQAGELTNKFDMESAIKEQGFWECNEYHCNECPYMRNLKCLERFGLLGGDPKYDPAYRAVLHHTPGSGMKFEPRPVEILHEGYVEIFVKPPLKTKSKKQLKREAKAARGKK